LEGFAQWLAGTSASAVVQKTLWLIPLMQTIHIICVALVVAAEHNPQQSQSAPTVPKGATENLAVPRSRI
jgi:hypothetical protein